MKTVQVVEKVLTNNPAARNSDKVLILDVLAEMGCRLTPEQREIFKSVSFESITRCRRKLQEEGKYPASEVVKKERTWKSLRMQQMAPKIKPDYIPTLINQKLF